MILKCTFSYFLVYTPSPKILKQYSIKVKKPCFPHFCYPSPAMSRNIIGYFSFHYRRYFTLLLCRAPQHCGVFCTAKYMGGGTK